MTTNTLVYEVDSNGVIHFQEIPEGVNLSTNIAGIIVIKSGAEARSTVLNDNFAYLNAKIEQTNTNLATTQTNVQSTIDTTLSVYQNIDKRDGQSVQPDKPTSGDVPLTIDSILAITPTGNVTFKTPTVTDGKYHQMLVQLNLTEVFTIDVGTTHYFDMIEPEFVEGLYDIIYEYDNTVNKWVCGSIFKGAVS